MTTFVAGTRSKPKGVRVAPTSFQDIEDLADELRPLLPKWEGSEWKVDAGRILEETLRKKQFKFDFHIEETEKFQFHAAFVWPDKKIVVVRRDVYDGLASDSVFSRSTVVHEFSHIAMGHPSTARQGPVGAHQHYEDSEWQANSLMAAIMMPLEACEEAKSLEELCQLCGTSAQASSIRIDKLIQKDFLNANHFKQKGGKTMRHK